VKQYYNKLAAARQLVEKSQSNSSGLLVACGDSLMLVVSAGIAAAGGNARTHH